MSGEAYFAFLNLFRAHGEELSDTIHKRLVWVPAETLLRAVDKAAALRPRFDEIARAYDAILTPSAPCARRRSVTTFRLTQFSRVWTLLHTPCITLPGCRLPECR